MKENPLQTALILLWAIGMVALAWIVCFQALAPITEFLHQLTLAYHFDYTEYQP